jgi:hypothetical protein
MPEGRRYLPQCMREAVCLVQQYDNATSRVDRNLGICDKILHKCVTEITTSFTGDRWLHIAAVATYSVGRS